MFLTIDIGTNLFFLQLTMAQTLTFSKLTLMEVRAERTQVQKHHITGRDAGTKI